MIPPNSVLHGDCLDLMSDIDDGSIDLILTDLPYGVTQNRWDSVIPFDLLWAHYRRIIKPNRAIVLTASQPFTSALVMSNPAWFKYEWIWRKTHPTGFLDANRRPLKEHENVLVFSDGATVYNPQMIKGDLHKRGANRDRNSANYGGFNNKEYQAEEYYPRSVVTIRSDNGRYVTFAQRPEKIAGHPTQKPVKLFQYLIRTYTNPGELILDNCAGSGTTAIAAHNTGRQYILIEKEHEYIDIINQRIDRETRQGMLAL